MPISWVVIFVALFCPKMDQWWSEQSTAIHSRWNCIPPIFWEPCILSVSRKASDLTKIWRFQALTKRWEALLSTGFARWPRAFTLQAEPCITRFRSLISFCHCSSKQKELKWNKTWSCYRDYLVYFQQLRIMKWIPRFRAQRSFWDSYQDISHRKKRFSMNIKHILAMATIKNSTPKKTNCASKNNIS